VEVGDLFGMKRVCDVLEAHMWSNLKRKPAPRRVMKDSRPNNDEDSKKNDVAKSTNNVDDEKKDENSKTIIVENDDNEQQLYSDIDDKQEAALTADL
jgi:hypothetical protein